MKTYLRKIVQNEKGMTLIESLLAMTILGIISVLFVTMLGTAQHVTNTSYQQTQSSMKAATHMEEATGVTAQAGNFQIQFTDGTSWSIPGKYVEAKDKEVSYQCFIPD